MATACSPATCDVSTSFYGYRPSLAANAVFLAVVALCLAATVAVAVRTRRPAGFGALLASACAVEVVAYAGRVAGWHHPWDLGSYAIAAVASTLGPVLLVLAIVLCARDVIRLLGPEHSPLLPPRALAGLLVSTAVVAGFVQGFGLAVTFADAVLDSGGGSAGSLAATGGRVVFAGLFLQSILLVALLGVLAAVLWRSRHAHAARRGYTATATTTTTTTTSPTTFHRGRAPAAPPPTRVKALLPAAVACALVCDAYRMAFYWGGPAGTIAHGEAAFVAAEGILLAGVALAAAVLNPALWLPKEYVQDNDDGLPRGWYGGYDHGSGYTFDNGNSGAKRWTAPPLADPLRSAYGRGRAASAASWPLREPVDNPAHWEPVPTPTGAQEQEEEAADLTEGAHYRREWHEEDMSEGMDETASPASDDYDDRATLATDLASVYGRESLVSSPSIRVAFALEIPPPSSVPRWPTSYSRPRPA